jgi:pyruvate dehydrogenase E1 component alpha subunit/2-oxoisovalerate dehydrogenase E1 component alpha subunit
MQLDRKKGDVYAASIRDQAGRTAFGEPLLDGAQTYLGSVEGPMRGRDGNVHRGRPKEGMPAMISHLGSTVSVINGMLMAKRFKGKSGMVGGASTGDGSTSTGAFHEGVNQAAIEKLPLVIAVANNQFAYSTSNDRQFACESLVDRAIGYGIGGHECDGTDLENCLSVFRKAIDLARRGKGPQMVVGKMLRLSGHGEHDDAGYVPETLKNDHFGRDCIEVAKQRVLDENWMSADELSDLQREIQNEVDTTVTRAQNDDLPSPVNEKWQALATSSLIEEQA